MRIALAALLLLVNQIDEQAADPVAVAAAASELREALTALKSDPVVKLGLPIELELERIVSIRTAALLRNVSVDSIIRHFQQFIIYTGGNRGLRLKHALGLDPGAPRLPKPRRKTAVPPRKRRFGQGAKSKTLNTQPVERV
jgi:hypothetical protein